MVRKEFKLPDIGEGIAEGEIVSWKVKAGQAVKEEDEFVEVMTDKATVTITVPFTGVIAELRCKEGDVVPVGAVIAVIDAGAAGGTAATPAAPVASKPATPAAPPPGRPAAPTIVPAAPPRPVPAPAPVATSPAAMAPAKAFVQSSPGKVLAAPATRRRARELGIDLAAVTATGPRGRITNDDLAAAANGPAVASRPAAIAAPAAPRHAPVSVAAAPAGRVEERIPFRGLRRKIAEAMTRSKSTAAHFTYVDDIDVTDLVKMRTEVKKMYADQGINVTYMPFIMKAIVAAMRVFPTMNSALDETANELVVKKYYNFGIATDTDSGLIVPVVKDVDRKTIPELAKDIQDVSARTRDGKVTIDDLTGGTFTITNAGNIGGLFATPIINFPEVAILGVHAIKDTPVIRDGQIVVGKKMYLSVSIDHRLVDGATGARWMNVVKEHLEQPWRLFLT
ncbi:MAG TPA: dihydrolipoamide acetyltransferase family protein [Planctomycetota bacterium]|nr:dihydrolipoamide acetyltransferase family protein [Planctomycetota bacterium]